MVLLLSERERGGEAVRCTYTVDYIVPPTAYSPEDEEITVTTSNVQPCSRY